MSANPQISELNAARASAARLQALAATGLLDSPAEDCFDRLTRLAATLLAVPVAYLALVEQDCAFLKSRYGMPSAAGHRLAGVGWSHYSIASRAPVHAQDLQAAPELRQLAEAACGLRAAAAVALRMPDGEAVGALCAADVKPRQWSGSDLEILTELAASAQREIALRSVIREAGRYREQVREAAERQEKIRATLAHDLRTPLSIIKLSTHTLAKLSGGDKSGEILERMQRAATRMAEMIDGLLDTATSGKEQRSGESGGEQSGDKR